MKKKHISPEIEFVRLSQCSVVCTSGEYYRQTGIDVADYEWSDADTYGDEFPDY